MAQVPTSDELIAAASDHTLATKMARRFGLSQAADVESAVALCAEVHREGGIDLLALVEDGDIGGLDGAHFFMASHFLCGALVQIDAPVERMMRVIDTLVGRGGADLMASEPNGTFRTWCARDPMRSSAVIRAAGDGDPLALKFLTFALEASNAMAEARVLALSGVPEVRMSAVTALSRMAHADPNDLRETLAIFHEVTKADTADNVRANTLHALAALLAASNSVAGPDTLDTFQLLLTAPGDYTLHQAAGVLWRHPQVLSTPIIALLLMALGGVNPANTGTIRDLDLALERLLTLGHSDHAIAFLTTLLTKADSPLDLGAFETFIHALVTGPPAPLSRAVTVWLVEGGRRLCESLSSALGSSKRDQPISLLAGDLARPPDELGLLCEHAIGFLFLQPTAAASILVSVLRVGPADMAQGVEDLLVETLLLNYGGLRAYLESLEPSDAAHAHVQSALARNEAYLAALRAIPDFSELRPSEHHREIERLRLSDQMQQAFKSAQRESVFLNMVTRSVILHGNGSLSYMSPPGAERRAMEIDLHSHGVSFEMPRLEIVDPVGLDYTLRVLRNRRRAS